MLSFFTYVTLLCKAEEGDSEAIRRLEQHRLNHAIEKALLEAAKFFEGEDINLGTLSTLIEAGYIEESGHSDTGFFWNFTEAGIERLEELESENQ